MQENQTPGGGARLQEKLTGGRVKGGMLTTHLEWVQSHYGAAGIERVMRKLDPTTAAEIESPNPASWYRFAAVVALDKAIVEVFSFRPADLLADLGRYSARINLTTSLQEYRREDIYEFFRKSAPLHSLFQDFGKVFYKRIADGRITMEHRDYPCFSPTYCASALGYYEEAVVVHGGRSARALETLCQCRGDQACVFDISWE